MNIYWDRSADVKSLGQTASVLLDGQSRAVESSFKDGFEPEVAVEPGRREPSELERLERLDAALAAARPRLPDGEANEIKRKVLKGAQSGLAKLNENEPPERFTFAEHVGLEAVILTNGERPSLVVQNGFVNFTAPDLGDWERLLQAFEAQIRRVVGSVGRIDIPVRPNFAGTCFVVADGFVVTNRHVAEVIATQDAQGAWTLRWPGTTTVDFGGEEGAAPGARFKVAAIAYAGADPINRNIDFTHMDMAVLRLEGEPESRMPDPVTFEADPLEPASERDIYLVGFPAEPIEWLFGGKPPAGYETTEVISRVFNRTFGIKRLAPGKITFGPGGLPNDPKAWVCAHDSSTLGGNSGSCIADLGKDGFRVLGLHFGGVARGQNWGHTVARLRDQLRPFASRFV